MQKDALAYERSSDEEDEGQTRNAFSELDAALTEQDISNADLVRHLVAACVKEGRADGFKEGYLIGYADHRENHLPCPDDKNPHLDDTLASGDVA